MFLASKYNRLSVNSAEKNIIQVANSNNNGTTTRHSTSLLSADRFRQVAPICTLYNTWSLRTRESAILNGNSIGSAVLAGLTVVINAIHLQQ